MNSAHQVLFSESEIRKRVLEMGREIDGSYPAGEPLYLIVIATGGIIFAADLMRAMPERLVYVETITAKSYAGTVSKDLKFKADLALKYAGKHVILMDDILDSGKTLVKLTEFMRGLNPASVKTCVFLDKPTGHGPSVHADFTGMKVAPLFVFGYGMDDAEGRYRNLPYIAALKA